MKSWPLIDRANLVWTNGHSFALGSQPFWLKLFVCICTSETWDHCFRGLCIPTFQKIWGLYGPKPFRMEKNWASDTHTQVSAVFCWGRNLQLSSVSNNITFLAISVKNELLIWFGWSIGSSIWFLQCCSSFRGSSSIWGARAPRVVKMASQLRILSSLAYQADYSSPFIYQTWIFCKKNGSKRSFLPEIEVQTFWYTLYAVTTACCVPWQIPREIWKNTAGKSATPRHP